MIHTPLVASRANSWCAPLLRPRPRPSSNTSTKMPHATLIVVSAVRSLLRPIVTSTSVQPIEREQVAPLHDATISIRTRAMSDDDDDRR